MKRALTVWLHLPLCFLLASCESEEPITGSSGASVLTGSAFTVTELVPSSTQLTARGTVKNNSNKTWSPVWIVEGEFYADSTFSFKIGGANKKYSYSLEKGVSTAWELRLTSSQFTLSDYPNFAVKNLRVVQEK